MTVCVSDSLQQLVSHSLMAQKELVLGKAFGKPINTNQRDQEETNGQKWIETSGIPN